MFFLMLFLTGYNLDFILLENPVFQFTPRKKTVSGPIDGIDIPFGEIILRAGKLEIGSTILYYGGTREISYKKATRDSENYSIRMYPTEVSYLPLILGYVLKDAPEHYFDIKADISFWGNKSETSYGPSISHDTIRYTLYPSADRFINLSANMNFKFSKGLIISLSCGLDFTHYNQKSFPDSIIDIIPERYKRWNLEPNLSLKFSHRLISIKPTERQSLPINSKKSFLLSELSGGLQGLFLTWVAQGMALPEGWNYNKFSIVMVSSSLTSSGLSWLAFKHALTYGKKNNIMEYITLGISKGIGVGFVNGTLFAAFFPEESVLINGFSGGICGGALGLIEGLINYSLLRP